MIWKRLRRLGRLCAIVKKHAAKTARLRSNSTCRIIQSKVAIGPVLRNESNALSPAKASVTSPSTSWIAPILAQQIVHPPWIHQATTIVRRARPMSTELVFWSHAPVYDRSSRLTANSLLRELRETLVDRSPDPQIVKWI